VGSVGSGVLEVSDFLTQMLRRAQWPVNATNVVQWYITEVPGKRTLLSFLTQPKASNCGCGANSGQRPWSQVESAPRLVLLTRCAGLLRGLRGQRWAN
jgi:hypothetical protein